MVYANFFDQVVSVTVRGQSFIDNGLSTRFVTHVPQRRNVWDKGFKDKTYHTHQRLITHCCQTLTIHEGRSDVPMSPQQPPKSVSSGQVDSPWEPLHPKGDVSKCAQWRIRWIEKGEKSSSTEREQRSESVKVKTWRQITVERAFVPW